MAKLTQVSQPCAEKYLENNKTMSTEIKGQNYRQWPETDVHYLQKKQRCQIIV